MTGIGKLNLALLGFLCIATATKTSLAAEATTQPAPPHIRCGLLIDPALRNSPVASWFEASLTVNDRITFVERNEIDKILQEQQLQAVCSPDGLAERRAFGKLIRADVLVMLRCPVSEKKGDRANRPVLPDVAAKPDRVEMIVCETHRGLRLCVWPMPITHNEQSDAASLQTVFTQALGRYGKDIRQIIAVPPFASQDLTHEFDTMQEIYPRLLQQMLLQRPGVLVVEISEARALSKELLLSSAPDIQRSLPFYLTGTYRHEGTGDKTTIAFGLEVKHGNVTLAKSLTKPVAITLAPVTLERNVRALLAPAIGDGSTLAASDMRSEAAELAAESRGFSRVGDWSEAANLAEASLLADPDQPAVHGLAFQAYNALAEAAVRARLDIRVPDLGFASLRYFNASIPHFVAYMRGTVLNPPGLVVEGSTLVVGIEQYWAVIQTFEPALSQTPEMKRELDATCSRFEGAIWDVLHYKSEAKIQDRTAEICRCLLGCEINRKYGSRDARHPGLNQAGVEASNALVTELLREFSYRDDTEHLCIGVCGYSIPALELAEALPDPKLRSVARKQRLILIATEKRVAKASAVASTQPYWRSVDPSKAVAPHIDNPEVTFTRLDPITNDVDPPQPDIARRIIGCVRAGPDVDVFWTHYLILSMKRKGDLKLAISIPDPKTAAEAGFQPDDRPWVWIDSSGDAARRPSICYDGRFVWFPVALAPPGTEAVNDPLNLFPAAHQERWALLAIDFQQVKAIWFTEKLGLPPGPIHVVPLAPGVVCVAGSFAGRTSCARAEINSEGNHISKSFKVIYEARELPPNKYPPAPDASYSYVPHRMLVVPEPTLKSTSKADTRPAPSNSVASAQYSRHVLLEHGPNYLSIDARSGATQIVPLPQVNTYIMGTDRSGLYLALDRYEAPSNVRSLNVLSWKPEGKTWPVPEGTILCDREVEVVYPPRHEYFVAPTIQGPYRKLLGFVPAEGWWPSQLVRSNFYGTLMISTDSRHSALYEVDFPKPLPELTPKQ